MDTETQVREFGPLQTRADVVPKSLNEEQRTVDVIWTAGTRVKRYSWMDGAYFEELSLKPKHVRMERLKSGRAPVLLQHNTWDPNAMQGVVVAARLEGDIGTATLKFARDDVDADKTWNKIRQGILTSISVGYIVHKMEKIEDGEDEIPVYRVVDWEPYELSPVSIPADIEAHTRSAARDAAPRNPCEIVNHTRAIPARTEQSTMDKTQQSEADAKAAELAATAKREAELKTATDAAAMLERERATKIRNLVREVPGLDAKFADELIDKGTPLVEARDLILSEVVARHKATASSAAGLRIDVGEADTDKFRAGAMAGLLARSGTMASVQAAAKLGAVPKTEADPAHFRGMSMISLARECLERAGVKTRMMSEDQIARLALSTRSSPGLATPSDFPVLLENTTNRVLLAAYATAPHEWDRFCSRGSVTDFNPQNRYRKGSFGTLDEINDHGEFQAKSIPDGEKRQVGIGSFGNTIGISRKMVIQDNMGAFSNLATEFGQAVSNTIEAKVWAVIKANGGLWANYDANPMFHASRNNLATASALTAANLDADATLMALQKDPSGLTVLNLVPAILVLPRTLKSAATIINNDQYDPDSGTKTNRTNPGRNLFRDIVATAQLTGTKRYLFADPAIAPAIEVTFLQGQEQPQMESQEGFEILGVQWRVFLDFGVNLVDYRGVVYNPGV